MDEQVSKSTYWRTNLKYLTILLSAWFALSFLGSIIFVDYLDRFKIGPFKLGFWLSQQGSIFGFVIIIFIYVFLMNRLDRKLERDEGKNL